TKMSPEQRINLFLRHVACLALKGRPNSGWNKFNETLDLPLPLHARAFLQHLLVSPSVENLLAELTALVQHVPCVSRLRRILLLAGTSCPAIGVVLFFSIFYLFTASPLGINTPAELHRCLTRILDLEADKLGPAERTELDALEIY